MKRVEIYLLCVSVICLGAGNLFQSARISTLEKEMVAMKKRCQEKEERHDLDSKVYDAQTRNMNEIMWLYNSLASNCTDLRKRLDKLEGKPKLGSAENPEPIFRQPK